MDEQQPGETGPTAEHERLLEKVGEWDVECSYFWDPSGEPMTVPGTDRVEALGPYWTLGYFHCNTGTTTINGLATTGYDPARDKYTGTWQDTSNPYLYLFEGELDESGTVLEMEGDNIDPMSQNLVKYRSVEEFHGKDRRTLHLYVETAPDQEVKILQYEYRRRK